MKQQPLISVITPAYNAAKFMHDTIDSVIAQTYQNWEMVIVDDCSKDDTVAIVTNYIEEDDRIKLFQLEKNSGSAVARNKAMELANGRYIAFLDSDDRWLPEKLEKQLYFMQEKDIAFSFTTYNRILEDGTPTNAISNTPESVDYDDLMKRCVIGCLTVMLDRDKVGHIKMVNIRTRQDYVYWLTITKQGFLAYGLPEILAEYRLVDNSLSSNKWKAAKRNWYVFREIEKQSLLKSIWYFANYVVRSLNDLRKWRTKR
jgi:teichuronic acid biosynthesis glycosyltransferase TuaG